VRAANNPEPVRTGAKVRSPRLDRHHQRSTNRVSTTVFWATLRHTAAAR